jgi:hypothetical protein
MLRDRLPVSVNVSSSSLTLLSAYVRVFYACVALCDMFLLLWAARDQVELSVHFAR